MRKKALEKAQLDFFASKYVRLNHWLFNASFKIIKAATIQTEILGFDFEDINVRLTIDGRLTVKEGFIFGASGPTMDTPNSREGSCYHDALYYISQQGGFKETYDGNTPCDRIIRQVADELIRDI